MQTAVVSKNGARRIRANGHLWIYKSDVRSVSATGGDVVVVLDEARNFVGRAFYSDSSEIALRIVTTADEEVNEDFWRRRISEAASRRSIADSNAWRVVSSEADLIPSLTVDNYAGVFVIQTLSQGTERLKSLFAEILRDEFGPIAIVERNDSKVRLRENLELRNGLISGDVPQNHTVDIDGMRFLIDPLDGQKTGSFLDQRENHLASRRFAHGRALDCFTFAGGFALNMANACDEVIGLDISEQATAAARLNAEINRIANVRFDTANVFDALREFERTGERFDTIVLDPPAFVKTKSALQSAARGYKEINLRALRILKPGGILITCSCSFHFTEQIFLETMEKAAIDAKRRLHLLEKRTQSSDHPILLGVPETFYLKCLVFRAIG